MKKRRFTWIGKYVLPGFLALTLPFATAEAQTANIPTNEIVDVSVGFDDPRVQLNAGPGPVDRFVRSGVFVDGGSNVGFWWNPNGAGVGTPGWSAPIATGNNLFNIGAISLNGVSGGNNNVSVGVLTTAGASNYQLGNISVTGTAGGSGWLGGFMSGGHFGGNIAGGDVRTVNAGATSVFGVHFRPMAGGIANINPGANVTFGDITARSTNNNAATNNIVGAYGFAAGTLFNTASVTLGDVTANAGGILQDATAVQFGVVDGAVNIRSLTATGGIGGTQGLFVGGGVGVTGDITIGSVTATGGVGSANFGAGATGRTFGTHYVGNVAGSVSVTGETIVTAGTAAVGATAVGHWLEGNLAATGTFETGDITATANGAGFARGLLISGAGLAHLNFRSTVVLMVYTC